MIKQLIAISFLLSVASAAISPSSASPSAVNFVNSTVNVVWSTGTTSDSKWTGTSFQSLTTFGPATSTVGNGTVYAYAVTLAAKSISVTSRSLNSTLLINGTSTAEGSMLADSTASVTPVGATITDGSAAVCPGLGGIGVIYQDTDSTNSYLNVWAFVYSASGTASTPVVLSAGTLKAPGATTSGIAYYNLQCVYDTAGIYYFAWSTQSAAYANNAFTYTDNGVYIQGINTTASNALVWKTAALAPATQPSNTGASGSSTLNLHLGLSNVTNASFAYLAYRSLNTGTLYYTLVAPVSISAGTVSSTIQAATDKTVTGGSLMYYPIGFITSTNGSATLLLNNASVLTSTTYSLAQYNITSAVASASVATTTPTASSFAWGGEYGSAGYFIIVGTTSSLTATYTYQTFNSTAALMPSASTLAQVPYSTASDFTAVSPGTAFVDTNGGLWFGYTVYDKTASGTDATTSGNAVAGYLGEVTASTWTTSTTSFGSLISASFSLFALIAAAVLAF